MPTLVSRPRPTAWGARGARAAFAALCATATLSACGGGGGGGDGAGTGPNGQGSATLTVAGTIVLAQGTTGAQLQITPAYERASGDPVAYATQTVAVSGAAMQQVPVTVDLASCLGDATRKSADQGAVCVVRATVSLVAGDRVLDTQTVGPVTLRAGTQTSQAVTLAEVASVRVTAPAGVTVTDGKAQVLVGQTFTPVVQALDANGAALSGRAVRWTSDAPAAAAVDAASGLVTPAAAGSATVTATVGGRAGALGVVVSRPPSPVTITAAGGAGSGTITSSPAGINCTFAGGAVSGTCTANFAAEQAVTLTATPGAGSAFAGWSRDCLSSGGAVSCTLPANAAARTAGVAFAAVQNLTVTVAGTGAGRVTSDPAGIDCVKGGAKCAAGFNDGATVTLTATTDGPSAFAGWGGACSGTGSCTVPMSQARAVTASFNAVPADTVSVTAEGPLGLDGSLQVAGTTVNGTPFNSALIINLNTSNSAPQFTFYVAPGTQSTLTFTANNGAVFTAWDGACAGTATASSCTPTPRVKNAVIVRLSR